MFASRYRCACVGVLASLAMLLVSVEDVSAQRAKGGNAGTCTCTKVHMGQAAGGMVGMHQHVAMHQPMVGMGAFGHAATGHHQVANLRQAGGLHQSMVGMGAFGHSMTGHHHFGNTAQSMPGYMVHQQVGQFSPSAMAQMTMTPTAFQHGHAKQCANMAQTKNIFMAQARNNRVNQAAAVPVNMQQQQVPGFVNYQANPQWGNRPMIQTTNIFIGQGQPIAQQPIAQPILQANYQPNVAMPLLNMAPQQRRNTLWQNQPVAINQQPMFAQPALYVPLQNPCIQQAQANLMQNQAVAMPMQPMINQQMMAQPMFAQPMIAQPAFDPMQDQLNLLQAQANMMQMQYQAFMNMPMMNQAVYFPMQDQMNMMQYQPAFMPNMFNQQAYFPMMQDPTMFMQNAALWQAQANMGQYPIGFAQPGFMMNQACGCRHQNNMFANQAMAWQDPSFVGTGFGMPMGNMNMGMGMGMGLGMQGFGGANFGHQIGMAGGGHGRGHHGGHCKK